MSPQRLSQPRAEAFTGLIPPARAHRPGLAFRAADLGRHLAPRDSTDDRHAQKYPVSRYAQDRHGQGRWVRLHRFGGTIGTLWTDDAQALGFIPEPGASVSLPFTWRFTNRRSSFGRRVLRVGSQSRCVRGPWRHLQRNHIASTTDLRGGARVQRHSQQPAAGPRNLRHLRRSGPIPGITDPRRGEAPRRDHRQQGSTRWTMATGASPARLGCFLSCRGCSGRP